MAVVIQEFEAVADAPREASPPTGEREYEDGPAEKLDRAELELALRRAQARALRVWAH